MALTGIGSQLEQETVNARLEASQKTIEELTAERERIAMNIHYPECWDTMAYPTLADAVIEITSCDPEQCNHPKEQA